MHIAYVPDDVLYKIFRLVQLDHDGRDELDHTNRSGWGSMAIVAISQVCRYWRVLAIDSSYLWTTLSIVPQTRLALLTTFLERSNTAPLKVSFSGGSFLSVKNPKKIPKEYPVLHARALSSHLDRFVEFTVMCFEPGTLHVIFSLFTSPATRLQRLDIHDAIGAHPFASAVPSLRHVTIRGSCAPWLQYSQLTSLILHTPWDESPSPTELFRALRNSPNLQELSLGSRHGWKSHHFPTPSVITLPQLRSLSFSWHHNCHGMPLLSSLSFPRTTAVHISYDGHNEILPHLIRDHPFWAAFAARPYDAQLTFSQYAGPYCRFALRSRDGKLRLEWKFPRRSVEDAMEMLRRAGRHVFQTPGLRSFDIFVAGTTWMSEQVWLSILRQVWREVRVCVRLQQTDERTALFLLSALCQEHTANIAAAGVLCPKLRKITFDSCEWITSTAVLSAAISTFRIRAASHKRLDSLAIRGMGRQKPPKALMTQLEEIVSNVILA